MEGKGRPVKKGPREEEKRRNSPELMLRKEDLNKKSGLNFGGLAEKVAIRFDCFDTLEAAAEEEEEDDAGRTTPRGKDEEA